MTSKSIYIALTCFSIATTGLANLQKAPPTFPIEGGNAVPMDISTAHVSYNFQVQKKIVTGHSTIKFSVGESGFPFFHIKPKITSVRLDGIDLAPSAVVTISAPQNASKLSLLKSQTSVGEHLLELDFTMLSDDVTFASDTVRSGFFMSDLDETGYGDQRFYEQYGPSNMEYDQIHYTFDVKVTETSAAHTVFTNGTLKTKNRGTNEWSIDFPDYFTSSSIYFHIAPSSAFQISEGVFKSASGMIPVTVYTSSTSLSASTLSKALDHLSELEKTYGPTHHKKFVIYATSSYPGGMEHSGATITNSHALSHELSHSWFARGVMPSDGNAGWIDEAIASWRDNGYPNKSTDLTRKVNLAGFSPFRRSTPMEAYGPGADLIAALSLRYKEFGGMKGLLKRWFAVARMTTVTTEDFKSFLEESTGDDLDAVFKTRVYGSSKETMAKLHPSANQHPRPFTAEQYKALR